MTADERLEGLLNNFGQTIEDLPQPKEGHYTYSFESKERIEKEAREWNQKSTYYSWDNVADYACRLTDIIDRMEVALETAWRLLPCSKCSNRFYEEIYNCSYCPIQQE